MIKTYLRSIEVAEYFIYKSQDEKNKVTPKKLQKLLYYAQAWFLVFENDKLFDEKIEAWLHGPAINSIYHEYKSFGFFSITKDVDTSLIEVIPSKIRDFLDNIWKIYGKYDADYLEILSHSEKPWQKARSGVDEFSASNNEIDTNLMKEFYSKLLEKSKDDVKKEG